MQALVVLLLKLFQIISLSLIESAGNMSNHRPSFMCQIQSDVKKIVTTCRQHNLLSQIVTKKLTSSSKTMCSCLCLIPEEESMTYSRRPLYFFVHKGVGIERIFLGKKV